MLYSTDEIEAARELTETNGEACQKIVVPTNAIEKTPCYLLNFHAEPVKISSRGEKGPGKRLAPPEFFYGIELLRIEKRGIDGLREPVSF
jgi:hypothetical protein